MLKRTKGRLLLAMLVTTGMAGTLNDYTLSHQERKLVLAAYKTGKTELLSATKSLTTAQLSFRPAAGTHSIQEHLIHIAKSEQSWGKQFEEIMHKPTNPQSRDSINITDAQIVAMPINCNWNKEGPQQTGNQLLKSFKSDRQAHINYIKKTTEDLRNRVFDFNIGKIDAYQFLLYMATHSKHHIDQIIKIKQQPLFPKK